MKKPSPQKQTAEKGFPCTVAITVPEEALYPFIEKISKIEGVTIEKIERCIVEDE